MRYGPTRLPGSRSAGPRSSRSSSDANSGPWRPPPGVRKSSECDEPATPVLTMGLPRSRLGHEFREPSPRFRPVLLDEPQRDSERIRGFLLGVAREETALDHAGLARRDARELGQRVVERDEL